MLLTIINNLIYGRANFNEHLLFINKTVICGNLRPQNHRQITYFQ